MLVKVDVAQNNGQPLSAGCGGCAPWFLTRWTAHKQGPHELPTPKRGKGFECTCCAGGGGGRRPNEKGLSGSESLVRVALQVKVTSVVLTSFAAGLMALVV